MGVVNVFCALFYICHFSANVKISMGIGLEQPTSVPEQLAIVQCVSNRIGSNELMSCVLNVPCQGKTETAWFFQGDKLIDTSGGKYEVSEFQQSCQLFTSFMIKDVSATDGGTYSLRLQHEASGSVLTRKFEVSAPVQLDIVQCVSNRILSYQLLSCVVNVPCQGKTDTAWFLEGVKLTVTSGGKYQVSEFQQNCRLFTSFKIDDVSAADEGTYSLRIQHEASGSVLSEEFKVSV